MGHIGGISRLLTYGKSVTDINYVYQHFQNRLGIFTKAASFTSSNTEGMAFIGNVWEGILFSNFHIKKAFFEKMLFMKICFIMQKELN